MITTARDALKAMASTVPATRSAALKAAQGMINDGGERVTVTPARGALWGTWATSGTVTEVYSDGMVRVEFPHALPGGRTGAVLYREAYTV